MKAFSGYEETKVNNYDYERLTLGGHICKILEVSIEKFVMKETGKEFEQLVLKIDIEEPDEQAGFYQRKYAEDAKRDALNTKWKGYFRVSIPEDDSSEGIKTAFKTFTTSVENSNPGYKWNWEENTLVGKLFGGVFGYEEFVTQDGRTLTMTKCRFARGTEKVLEAKIPKVKLADKTYMDYEEYMEKRKEERNQKDEAEGKAMEETSTIESDDDLPF